MRDCLSDAAEAREEHRIGIHVNMRRTTDAVELQPRELERLRMEEAHLRAALSHARLTLTPLGYIDGACVQYETRSVADDLDERGVPTAPIQKKLEQLVEQARAARTALASSTQSAAQPDGGSARTAAIPGVDEAVIPTVDARSGVGNSLTPAAGATEVVAPMPAPRLESNAKKLMHDIQRGPEIITVDDRPMPWSSAVMPADVPEWGAKKTIECTTAETERHFIDRRGRRYRVPESFDAAQLGEGARVRVDGTRTEHVLAATILRQPHLAFSDEDRRS